MRTETETIDRYVEQEDKISKAQDTIVCLSSAQGFTPLFMGAGATAAISLYASGQYYLGTGAAFLAVVSALTSRKNRIAAEKRTSELADIALNNGRNKFEGEIERYSNGKRKETVDNYINQSRNIIQKRDGITNDMSIRGASTALMGAGIAGSVPLYASGHYVWGTFAALASALMGLIRLGSHCTAKRKAKELADKALEVCKGNLEAKLEEQ